jgi:hypothetical protein
MCEPNSEGGWGGALTIAGAKTGQFSANSEDFGTKSQENCGNRAFVVDFNCIEAAL